jgi:hypothetical protein
MVSQVIKNHIAEIENRNVPEALSKMGPEIQKLAESSETAKNVLYRLAVRERHTHSVELPRFKNELIQLKLKVVDEDFNYTFKRLDELKVGALIFGRKGNSDRFEFHYSMRDVGNLSYTNPSVLSPFIRARDEAKQMRKLYLESLSKRTEAPKKRRGRKAKIKAAPAPKVEAPKVKTETGTVHMANKILYVPIRKGFGVQIVVPSDLNMTEAEIISDALKQLSA